MEVSTRPHSSQHFDQRAQREARYRGYDIVMQRRDLCRMVTMKPSRPRVSGVRVPPPLPIRSMS